MYNLISGKLVTDIVRTSLGPRGMEKMYIDILGEDTITSHGGAFLRKVDVDHPAAKSVIEAVNTVDTHVGDGTTSAAVLIGSLLKEAKELLKIGIPTATITRGYEKSLDYTLRVLDEIKIKSDRRDKKVMKQLLITCLDGKAIFDLQEENTNIVDIIIDAICDISNLENGTIDVDDIKIEEKIGNSTEIQLIKGTVIDKTIDSSAMPRTIKDAKILLINESLETMRTRTEATIEIESPEQMNQFLNQENKDLLVLVKHIVDSGANVVISRKGINQFVQEALAKKNIITMRRVKYNDLWWLEKATGANTCENIEKISDDELGFAKKVYEKTVGGEKMIFVEGNNPKSVTLLLRANSKRYVNDVFMKNIIDNTHCHVDGVVHAHHDPGKNHNHFEQEGLEQRQMHQYY